MTPEAVTSLLDEFDKGTLRFKRISDGADDEDNLALACNRCNACKGPNLTGIDLETSALVPLFHPRLDSWADHFEFQHARIVGRTPKGRATVAVLQMNDDRRLERRAELLALGELP